MSEYEEVQKLISIATYPGVKANLEKYLKELPLPITKPIEPEIIKPTINNKIDDITIESSPKKTKILPTVGAFIPIEGYSWDQGAYNTPILTIYIDLPNVGSVKDKVKVEFGKHSFDLKIFDLDGKNYRLLKDNLEKDIIPDQSKVVVKSNKLLLKLHKVKGEYSYDNWTALTAKKGRDESKEAEKKKDPMGGIMDMMKDMYEDGDENMKKIIGEAMMKSQRGEKPDAPSGLDEMPDMSSLGKGLGKF
eukprot:gene20780-26940_t